jgi:hypothetical protein
MLGLQRNSGCSTKVRILTSLQNRAIIFLNQFRRFLMKWLIAHLFAITTAIPISGGIIYFQDRWLHTETQRSAHELIVERPLAFGKSLRYHLDRTDASEVAEIRSVWPLVGSESTFVTYRQDCQCVTQILTFADDDLYVYWPRKNGLVAVRIEAHGELRVAADVQEHEVHAQLQNAERLLQSARMQAVSALSE